MGLKKYSILLILTIFSFSSFAQEVKEVEQKSFFKKILGDPLESSITFMPVGTHTRKVDVFGVWYVGYNYKSFEVAAFSNSFSELTIGLFYKRAWNFTKRFSAIYGVGIMYGYHGKLQDVEGVPFRNSFLMTGEINPVAGFELDYKISKRFAIHANITPLVIIYGFKYYL